MCLLLSRTSGQSTGELLWAVLAVSFKAGGRIAYAKQPHYHEFEEDPKFPRYKICKECGYKFEEWWHTNFIAPKPELDGII